MIEQCFVSLNPVFMIIIALLLSCSAIYTVFISHRGEKTTLLLILLFLFMTAIGFVFIPCWAFAVSLIEMGLAYHLYKNKIRVLVIK
jgi:hypothetical protein